MGLPGRPNFEFDSSFIGPQAEKQFTKFATLMQTLQKQDKQTPQRFPPISIFGHADPTGGDTYNKPLSGRRARSVYGLLTHNVKIWDELFRIDYHGDRWGMRSIRLMLSISLRKGPPPEPSFFTGPIETPKDPVEKKQLEKQTHDAIEAYQEARGLKKTGFPNEETRALLFSEYMTAICHDAAGNKFELDPVNDFVARNKDKEGHKGDIQGCSDFNPRTLLSKAEEDLLNSVEEFHEARNERYAKDRRVVAFIFKHGTEIDPKAWPCPLATDPSTEPCTRRFWSDEKKRRERGDDERQFGKNMDLAVVDADGTPALDDKGHVLFRPVEETGNIMRCRFYHAFAVHSPCEAGVKEWIIRFQVDSFKTDATGKKKPEALAGRRFVLLAGEERRTKDGQAVVAPALIRGITDPNGEIKIPVFDPHVRMTLKLDAFGKPQKLDDDAAAGTGPAAGSQTTDVAAPNGAGTQAKPGSGFDTDKFPDEDKFISIALDGGALREMSEAEQELPSKQRLYNLGFGSHEPKKWTDDEFQRAVKQYRRTRGIGKETDPITPDLREKIRSEHEIEGAPPPPDDDDANQPT
jgi:hypothetical protein